MSNKTKRTADLDIPATAEARAALCGGGEESLTLAGLDARLKRVERQLQIKHPCTVEEAGPVAGSVDDIRESGETE